MRECDGSVILTESRPRQSGNRNMGPSNNRDEETGRAALRGSGREAWLAADRLVAPLPPQETTMPTIASDPTSASDPAQREKLKKWMETVLPIPDGTKVEAGMVVIPADCADPFAAFMGALGTPLVIPMDFADGPDRTSKVTVCTACRGVDGCLPGCTRSGAGETT